MKSDHTIISDFMVKYLGEEMLALSDKLSPHIH